MITGCFGTNKIIEYLAADETRKAHVTVETINCTSENQTTAVDGLIARPSEKYANCYPSSSISLPTVFGFEGLPVNQKEIPTPRNLQRWEYLKRIFASLPEFDENIPFGLIIGGSCPKALEPLEVITSEANGPYAYRTSLGWCVVGPLSSVHSDNQEVAL